MKELIDFWAICSECNQTSHGMYKHCIRCASTKMYVNLTVLMDEPPQELRDAMNYILGMN